MYCVISIYSLVVQYMYYVNACIYIYIIYTSLYNNSRADVYIEKYEIVSV